MPFNFANYLAEAVRTKLARDQFAKQFAENQRQFDTNLSENRYQFGKNLSERQYEFGEQMGQRRFEFNTGTGQWERTFAENKRINDRNFNEGVRQFNMGVLTPAEMNAMTNIAPPPGGGGILGTLVKPQGFSPSYDYQPSVPSTAPWGTGGLRMSTAAPDATKVAGVPSAAVTDAQVTMPAMAPLPAATPQTATLNTTVPLAATGGFNWRSYQPRIPNINRPMTAGAFATLMGQAGAGAKLGAEFADEAWKNQYQRPYEAARYQHELTGFARTEKDWAAQDKAQVLGTQIYELAKQGRFQDIIDQVFESPYRAQLLNDPSVTHATAAYLQKEIDQLNREIEKESGWALWDVVPRMASSIDEQIRLIKGLPLPPDKKKRYAQMTMLLSMLTGDTRSRAEKINSVAPYPAPQGE